MKIMTNSEMRAIDGGWRLVCDTCDKTKHTHTKAGYTAFVLAHQLGCARTPRYDIWEYKRAGKQNCCW